MYLIRTHLCPVTDGVRDTVESWQIEYIEKYDAIPTPFDINYRIKKYWRREDVWEEYTFPIEIHKEKLLLQAISSESIEQQWMDIKPEGSFKVTGVENYSNKRCAICLERYEPKIRLIACNCLFHRECIETSAKYRDSCPKCFTTINMTKV